jgi:rSAM/selenodomain-associated transferase 1
VANDHFSGVLQIFVKNRQAGKVKTRLAAVIGNDEALKVYEQLLFVLKKNLMEQPLPLQIYYSDFKEVDDSWDANQVEYHVQRGEDLGERITHAMSEGTNHFDFVILIGSDCPEIHTSDIYSCIDLLDKNDVVIGPSLDGGYYLIACKGYFPELFRGIPWSTTSVFEETVKKVKQSGLTLDVLPEKRDLDEYTDYQYFKENRIL